MGKLCRDGKFIYGRMVGSGMSDKVGSATFVFALLALLITLQVADVITTSRFIFIVPDAESNPIGRWLFLTHGFQGLVFGKAIVITLAVFVILFLLKRGALKIVNVSLLILNIYYTLIVALTTYNNAVAFGWDNVSFIYVTLLLGSTGALLYLMRLTLRGR